MVEETRKMWGGLELGGWVIVQRNAKWNWEMGDRLYKFDRRIRSLSFLALTWWKFNVEDRNSIELDSDVKPILFTDLFVFFFVFKENYLLKLEGGLIFKLYD